jgi:hypothetical protein
MPIALFASKTPFHRTTLHAVCALGAMAVGVVFILYAIFLVPGPLASSYEFLGFQVLLAMVGALSIVGALGYWMNTSWGLFFRLISTLGQLFLAGSLFTFTTDLYNIAGWISPFLSLIILILMGARTRR